MINQRLHELFLKSTGVCTDTRKISKGCMFFALKGSNFNGNTFAQEALDQGAAFAIIDEEHYVISDQTILVKDALKALQDLAYGHRKHLDLPIIALTGSNGKTTTKELINSVLSKKFKTVATQGNLNNHIGVPLTLLSMTKETELGIVEMGANHRGEINALCEIAAPDYGYITNFGKAHLEGFGGVEGVIKGKSELYKYLIGHKGSLILNCDDPLQKEQLDKTHTFSFGSNSKNDLKITYKKAEPFAKIEFKNTAVDSKLIGQYNATNLAAAAAFGTLFKIEPNAIQDALENYIPSNNRSQIIREGSQTIIMDAYNANPTSMEAALRNLAVVPSKYKFAILGDMFELGTSSPREHQVIADLAHNLKFTEVILVGEHFGITKNNCHVYKTTQELLKQGLPDSIQHKIADATVLIKGSRGMALEQILDLLTKK